MARWIRAGVWSSLAALLLLPIAMPDWVVNRLFFYPLRYPQGEWELQSTVGAADRWLRTADNVRLHSWWVPGRDARWATLFLHGNAGNVTHRAYHALELNAAGSSVLLLDYRGYGRSEGQPTERGLYADADAGYQELRHLGYPPDRIVLHGESLGTAVAVELATRQPCAGVVLEAPLASARQMAASVVPVLGPLLVRGFDTAERIRRVKAPLLILHGDRDEIVPFTQGQTVFAAANQPKWFWRVDGAGHNDLVESAGPRYRVRLREFYE